MDTTAAETNRQQLIAAEAEFAKAKIFTAEVQRAIAHVRALTQSALDNQSAAEAHHARGLRFLQHIIQPPNVPNTDL